MAINNAAAAAAPCADYTVPPNAAAANSMVLHTHMGNHWWDTTTVPLPWMQPYTPPVPTVGTITVGGYYPPLYTTREQKAELVLAVLLNVLVGKKYVELRKLVVHDEGRDKIEFVYEDYGMLIRVPEKMRFNEIVDALYVEFGNLRGKEIK